MQEEAQALTFCTGLECSIYRKLRSGQKVDLIKCILNQAADPPSSFQADRILNGAVFVQMLPAKQLETGNPVELVFDEYRKDSKTATGEKMKKWATPKSLTKCIDSL